jgi:hypothetical protein
MVDSALQLQSCDRDCTTFSAILLIEHEAKQGELQAVVVALMCQQ